MKTILLDPQSMFLQAIQKILTKELNLEVVASSGEGEKGVSLIRQYRPAFVFLDVKLTDESGLKVCQWIKERHPEIKVILLTDQTDTYYIEEAIELGVDGYLSKTMESQEFIKAVEWIKAGQVYYYPPVLSTVVKRFCHYLKSNPKKISDDSPYFRLSQREREVLKLIAQGNSNREIGDTLHITDKTVKNHVSNILVKLSVKDRMKAAYLSIKNGWVAI